MANNKIEGGVWVIFSKADESDEYWYSQLGYWHNDDKLWHTSFLGQQFIVEYDYNDGSYHIQSHGQDVAVSKPCSDTDKHVQFDYIEALFGYIDLIHIDCPTSGAFECFDSNGGIIIPYNGGDNLYGTTDSSNINLEPIDKRYKQYNISFKDLNNFDLIYNIFINPDNKSKYNIESRIDSPSLYMTKIKHVDYNMYVTGCNYQDESIDPVEDAYMTWNRSEGSSEICIKYIGEKTFEYTVTRGTSGIVYATTAQATMNEDNGYWVEFKNEDGQPEIYSFYNLA